jgi:hypothetical protein
VDELDETIEVFGGDLDRVRNESGNIRDGTYSVVLLVEVVHVSVEDLNEQFHRHCGVHAGISHAERTL